MGQVIFLDSMVFIYLFEEDQRFISQVRPIFKSIESSQFIGITSLMSLIETLSPSKYTTDHLTQNEITRFFQETPNLSIFPIDVQISLEAARLRRENTSLKTPDAIQLATALVHQAGTFITGDSKLKNLHLPNLKISILGN